MGDIPTDDRSEDKVVVGESVDRTEAVEAEANVPRTQLLKLPREVLGIPVKFLVGSGGQ